MEEEHNSADNMQDNVAFSIERAQKGISDAATAFEELGMTVAECIHACHALDETMKAMYPGLYPIVTGEMVIDMPSIDIEA